MVYLASAPLRPRLYPSGGAGGGFPSAQVMQWLAHWRAPAWAKRRLGHGVLSCRVPLGGGGWLAYPPSQPGYPFSGYPCRWVSSGYPAPGRGSPAGGGPWAWRGVAIRYPHFSAEGGTQIVRTPGRGRHNVPTPWRNPGQTPVPPWFRRASRGSLPTGLLQSKVAALQTNCRWRCRHNKAGQSS